MLVVAGSLIITSVQLDDRGLYRCTASNQHGSTSETGRLEVLGKYVTSTSETGRLEVLGAYAASTVDIAPAPVYTCASFLGNSEK